jgi:hypothetical protein
MLHVGPERREIETSLLTTPGWSERFDMLILAQRGHLGDDRI